MRKVDEEKLQKTDLKLPFLRVETSHTDTLKTQSFKKQTLKAQGATIKPATLPLKKTLMATAMLPALTLASLYPAHAAPNEQGEKPLFGRMFSFGKNKENESETVSTLNNEQASVTVLQQDVRELTGKIEELNHTVAQMQEQIKQLQNALSLTKGQNLSGRQDSTAVTEKNTNNQNNIRDTKQGKIVLDDILPTQSTATVNAANNDTNAQKDTADIKAFSKKQTVQAMPEQQNSADIVVQDTPQGGNGLQEVPATENAKELYAMGYRYILSGDYRAAESVFVAFQQRYPDDALMADASFWLGEALFGQKRYREAAQIYIDVQRNYSDSPRGPENLLKLGMSMSELDEQKIACETFAKVTERYDNIEPAVLKRLKDEQNSNNCS